jgi:hypothetical protein
MVHNSAENLTKNKQKCHKHDYSEIFKWMMKLIQKLFVFQACQLIPECLTRGGFIAEDW